jgi:hypothetical protein
MTLETGLQVYVAGASRLAATILGADESIAGEAIYHIAYAEGGDGWWPESSLFPTEEERRVAEAPALVEEKARKLAALADRRWRAETGGTTIAGRRFSSDEKAQGKLTAAVVASVLDNAYQLQWKLADGAFVTLDHATLIAAAQGVRAHVQACFDEEAARRSAIVAAEDRAALAAIDIESGWPG